MCEAQAFFVHVQGSAACGVRRSHSFAASTRAGEGRLGAFQNAAGEEGVWVVGSNGEAIQATDGKRSIQCWTPEHAMHFDTSLPLALLMDRGTASSGDAIAIAFAGRPNARSFGRKTHGR